MPLNLWILLLAAYTITFGLQNDKLPAVSLRLRKIPFFEKMFECPYCTGFHAGWVVWVLSVGAQGLPAEGWHNGASVILTALASATFCYALDVALQFLEKNSPLGGGE